MVLLEYNKNVIEENKVQSVNKELWVPENPRGRYFKFKFKGSFGRVKLVKNKDDGKYYCAKIMKKI